jgi:hypothetical protein
MGETRVDLLHLLEDLADAYPGDLEETVLTEIVANALDSGATTIAILADAAAATLTVVDDGSGMRRADLRRFHDVAASTKQRGEGIGFAGVGIKLGLLISEDVVTESRRGKEHVATSWALTNRRRAPWHWLHSAPDLVTGRGTAVRLRLTNPLSPLLDRGFLESTLRRHFEPLLDPYFDEMLREHYPAGVQFTINGAAPARAHDTTGEVAALELRLPRKRKPSALGYIARHDGPLPEDRRGIAVSTYGKVIKRGWDWIGLTPATPDRLTGLVEAPQLATALTLNKADFLRAGARGAVYLSYRKALQEAVTAQLSAWGNESHGDDGKRRRAARPVERDLEGILIDLIDQFPILATLVDQRSGGRKRMPVATAGSGMEPESIGGLFAQPPEDTDRETALPNDAHDVAPADDDGAEGPSPPTPPATPPAASPAPAGPTGRRTRQPMRLGLTIQFETRPDDAEMARLLETTVWVNESHPAYRRAAASRSEGYHLALAVAMALSDVAVEIADARAFITEFLARWGESIEGRSPRRRKPRSRAR